MNQTDRHSQLSPNGELENIARSGCQGVFAHHTATHEGLIFTDAKGTFIEPDYFDDHIFDPIRVKAGLSDIRFHNLRHFFASMLIAQGESAKYVSDQLGHASIQITFDTYGHLFPQAKAEASAKLEKRMFEGRKDPFVRRVLEKDGNVESEEGVT